jgi:hypothetical protein
MHSDAAATLPGRSRARILADERATVVLICVALFSVTLLVYWLLGPQTTGSPHQVSQANNLIHGHIDLQAEYTINFENVERSLYDGEGFCYPPGDPQIDTVPGARVTPDCKTYLMYSPMPAFVAIPPVLIFGNEFNQTLLSVLFGAATAPIVFLVAARFSSKRSTQLWMTALMMFGTLMFWVASNGGVWFFAHATAVFFIFAAIYFTLARPNPLFAAALLGAAFLCRPTMLASGMFFVLAFAPLWVRRPEDNDGHWGVNPSPIASFAAGLMPFLAIEGLWNYLRFDSPLETGYGYTEQAYQDFQKPLYVHGQFDVRYFVKHPRILFEAMPVFTPPGDPCDTSAHCAPVIPSQNGLAIWVTTPAFLLSVFTGVTDRRIVRWGAIAIALACAYLMARAMSGFFTQDWITSEFPPIAIEMAPFWAMIGIAVYFSWRTRDLLVAACWAAIIPICLELFYYAATGWSQFGYRYGLDFTPFLWLLVARFVGEDMKWWVKALIVAGIIVNLAGVLFFYHLDGHNLFGWTWVAQGDRLG